MPFFEKKALYKTIYSWVTLIIKLSPEFPSALQVWHEGSCELDECALKINFLTLQNSFSYEYFSPFETSCAAIYK